MRAGIHVACSFARVIVLKALVGITKEATVANLTIRIKVDRFATGKDNQIANTSTEGSKEIVLHLHGRHVVLEGPVTRHGARKRIVIHGPLLYTAIAHLGVGRRNTPGKPIVVHVKVTHANHCPATQSPVVRQPAYEVVVTQIKVI
jgi:hypothetical protein